MKKEGDYRSGNSRQMVWSYDEGMSDKGVFNDAFYLLDEDGFELEQFFPIEDHDWDWTGSEMFDKKDAVKAAEKEIRAINPIKEIRVTGKYYGKGVEIEFGFPAAMSSYGRYVSLSTEDGADLESLSEAMGLGE